MKPIPKKLLIHTVTLVKEGDVNRWGDKSTTGTQEIQYVRMESSARVIRDKNSAEIQLAAILFYDCVNSRPKEIDFAVDDVILFNGQRHSVKVVEPLYDGKRLHHYELGLIKHA